MTKMGRIQKQAAPDAKSSDETVKKQSKEENAKKEEKSSKSNDSNVNE